MILKTYLKKNGIELNNKQQSHLGSNIYRCFRTIHPDVEIKKVSISSSGIKMNVYDYPRDFFETDRFHTVLTRFLNKTKKAQLSNQ